MEVRRGANTSSTPISHQGLQRATPNTGAPPTTIEGYFGCGTEAFTGRCSASRLAD